MKRRKNNQETKMRIGIIIGTIVLVFTLLSIGALYWSDDNKPKKYEELIQTIQKQEEQKFTHVSYTKDESGSEKVVVYLPTDDQNKALEIPFNILNKFYIEEHYEEKDEVVILKLSELQKMGQYNLYQVVREVYQYNFFDYKLVKSEPLATLVSDASNKFLKFSELFENFLFDDTAILNILKEEIVDKTSDEINRIVYSTQIEKQKLDELILLYTQDGINVILNNSNSRLTAVPLDPTKFIGYLKQDLVFENFKETYNQQQEAILAAREVAKSTHLDKLITEIKGNKVTNKVALTFDDGPNPYTTPIVLDVLKKYNIKATFFVLGQRISGNEELLKRIVLEGHEIGNHSWSHPDLTKLSKEDVAKQISDTQNKIYEVTGVYPTLLRPPYGAYNKSVYEQAKLPIILWNVDSQDWSLRNTSKVTNRVVNITRAGSIVLMHDIHMETAKAVESIILGLQNKGYTFSTVKELYHSGQITNSGVVYFGQNDANVVK